MSKHRDPDDKKIIGLVRQIAPKYDKHIHSHIKSPDYGITWREGVTSYVIEQTGRIPDYVPTKPVHRRRAENPETKRVSARVPKAEYALLQQCLSTEGITTDQDMIIYLIKRYLKRKSRPTVGAVKTASENTSPK